jgi:hypothetical protein
VRPQTNRILSGVVVAREAGTKYGEPAGSDVGSRLESLPTTAPPILTSVAKEKGVPKVEGWEFSSPGAARGSALLRVDAVDTDTKCVCDERREE